MNKIMELGKWDNGVMLRASCACTDKDCDMGIEIERDDGFIYLNLYKTLTASSYYNDGKDNSWFREKYKRVKMALKILFFGYVESEAGFIFDSGEQLTDFVETLTKNINYLKKKG